MQHLNLTEDDSMLVITSAGDNALHYAIDGKPKRIHTVDFNPCQGHLLELKLACYNSLEYEDFWMMFGEGKHPRFREVSTRFAETLTWTELTCRVLSKHSFSTLRSRPSFRVTLISSGDETTKHSQTVSICEVSPDHGTLSSQRNLTSYSIRV